MLVMGIDPGNAITGYGLVNLDLTTEEMAYINHDFIEDRKAKYPISLVYITSRLASVFKEYSPDIVAIEGPKHVRGFKSHQKQIELIGCIKRLLVSKNIPFVEIEPSSMKRIVVGNGRASKEEVAIALSERFGIPFEKIVRVDYYKSGKKVGQIRSYTLDGSDALGLAVAFPKYYAEFKKLDFKGV